jgi:hypothetical protein
LESSSAYADGSAGYGAAVGVVAGMKDPLVVSNIPIVSSGKRGV